MKKVLALITAAALALGVNSTMVFAQTTTYFDSITGPYDQDGDRVGASYSYTSGTVSVDVSPGQTIYFELPPDAAPITGLSSATVSDVVNSSKFTFKLDRDENGKYLSTVKLVTKKLSSGGARKNYIEVVLKESTMSEEKKVSFDAYFKAKNSETGWDAGDIVNTRFEMWVNNNIEDGEDADLPTGEGVVFNPVSNEKNTITWGNNFTVASLAFTANDDARKFYAKLSTKVVRDVYADYGDPVDADLFFRTFTGSPAIDSTSRAVLTLYNPWNEDNYNGDDYDYAVDPEDVYIYSIDSDGYLTDVTDRFTYVTENETDAGYEGWQMRVRVLGSYVLSDTELDIGEPVEEPEEPEKQDPASSAPVKPTPAPPPTGSNDMVAGAVALGVISLAAFAAARKRK